MARKKGTGLLVVWCEVGEDDEPEFNRWYNDEHLAERLSVPGILSVARYEAVSSGPKHLAVYELENSAVMESPEYREMRQNPTEWSKRMSPDVIGSVYIRNVYEMIHPRALTDEIADSPMAPALQIGRMDIPPGVESEWNRWYDTVYVPNYEKVPGVIRGRRYRAVVGSPKYLTVYEFELAERGVGLPADCPPRQRANARGDAARPRLAGHLEEDVRARRGLGVDLASFYGFAGRGFVQLPLLLEQELVGVAGVLPESVLGPHHQLIAGRLLLTREVVCHGPPYVCVYREGFQFIQREQGDAIGDLISDPVTAHQSPFCLGIAHLRLRQVV